jgi:hypothetical protein
MFDGELIWVVDSTTDEIYGYRLEDLLSGGVSVNATIEFPLDPDNDDATGM